MLIQPLTEWRGAWFIERLIQWLAGGWRAAWFSERLIQCLTEWLTEWRIGCSTERLIQCLTELLTEWFIQSFNERFAECELGREREHQHERQYRSSQCLIVWFNAWFA